MRAPTQGWVRAALAAASILCLAGCTRPINRAAERRIRDVLPSFLGTARIWRAHVDNAPGRTISGRLHRVVIEGEQVLLRQTVACESLRLEMRDAVVDPRRGRLTSVGNTTFVAVITEKGLNDYIRKFPPPPDEPVRIRNVTIRSGSLRAESTRRVLGQDIGYAITAEPRLESATRLRFDPDRMSVFGLPVPLPGIVLRFLAKYLSEGFDFTTLPFPVRISRFVAERGRIVIEGSADVMSSLNERIGEELQEIEAVSGEESW